MKMRIPLIVGDFDKLKKKTKRLRGVVSSIANEKLENALVESRLDVNAETYLAIVLYSTFIWFSLFFGLFAALFISQDKAITIQAIIQAIEYGGLLSLIFFMILFYYPVIISKKIGEKIDQDLMYALQDIIIQTRSGVALFNALVNVANSKYDYVSEEFKILVRVVEGGAPLAEELKELALTTKSEFLKKACWQLVNSIKSGSSIPSALKITHDELIMYQEMLIKNYIKELNVLSLIYLTLAVVVPTIGITIVIILSTFGGISMDETMMTGLIAMLLTMQPILIVLIKTRRPMIRL